MTIAFAILSGILLCLLIAFFLKAKRLEGLVGQKDAEVAAARQDAEAARQQLETEATRVQQETQARLEQESERIRKHYETEAVRIQVEAQGALDQKRSEMDAEAVKMKSESQARIAEAQKAALNAISEAQVTADRRRAELDAETTRIREHYELESRKVREETEALVSKAFKELEPLRKYEGVRDAEVEAQRQLAEALNQAASLRAEAQSLLEAARTATKEERAEIIQKANDAKRQADSVLDQAVRDAGRIVKDAETRAEQIGGDAYVALRDKAVLDQAVKAIWNVVEGYGDRYIIPTRSVLDDLASDFGHTEAGVALKAARDQTRRMIEQELAAACNYVEEDRRVRANRFVTDAFNGRVDAILSRTKHDNFGTLEQEVRDAFSLVNLNGLAFRDARILPAYLDARLAELKWAVVVQELKLKAREEQRRIQEQMREEEKVRREQERAIQEAQKEEDMRRQAKEAAQKQMEDTIRELKARLEKADGEQRAQLQREYQEQVGTLTAQLEEKDERLREAEEKKQREISMAQLTRAGNVYIISNIGSFGEDVFKIGMTRRREPMERIWELGDASVPFEFDVHAMIYSEDAPTLENLLHTEFDDLRINKVNGRKEFFRLPLHRIRDVVVAKGLNASFTMAAEAHEFRETQALEKMTPEQREKYHIHRKNGDASGNV